ncbi:MAG: cation-translocating P-type ATPase [Desulfobacterales bacterium]|nr:cation-translocating P-type ATPase [Desulfobacterales bacterium]
MPLNREGCTLCGLPLIKGDFRLSSEGRVLLFCCQGCRQVYLMLSEAADAPDPSRFRETDLFRRCVAAGIIPASEAELARALREQHPVSAEAPPAPSSPADAHGHQLTVNLTIDGMWCPACAWVIEETLLRSKGVTGANCNFATDRLRCTYQPEVCSPDRITALIRQLGYHARRPQDPSRDTEKRRLFIRLAITTFLSMNVMMLSIALYSGFFTQLDPDSIHKLSWPLVVMTAVVMFYGGGPVHRKALSGIVQGRPGMEALISIGAVCAFAYSLFGFLVGSIHLYFDTACMLITLVLLGKILERGAKDRIQEDLEHYFSLAPAKVRRCTTEFPRGRFSAIDELKIGDEFVVAADEIVPADGLVLEGEGTVDESSLTGEPRARAKRAGDRLQSGTRVLEGPFRLRTEGVGADATLGQMLAIMEAALGRRTVFEGRTDVILRWFVPFICLLAMATGGFVFMRGASLDEAFVRTLTVLVISCPCALGIAIPLARVAAVTLAARRGILVQDFQAFDQAEKIDTVVLDKTGTMTRGNWRLEIIRAHNDWRTEQILGLAAGLEVDVDHAVATEIQHVAKQRGIEPLALTSREVRASGVSALWGQKVVCIGAHAATAPPDPSDRTRTADTASSAMDAIVSWVSLTVDGQLAATLGFGDRLKKRARDTVAYLQSQDITTLMVSGDGDMVTRTVGRLLGIEHAQGEMRPADKSQLIADIQRRGGVVAMMGDGVNDAPALVSADIGLALFAGRNLGKEAQAVTLMRGDPAQLVDFLVFAGGVRRKILQNLVASGIYNLVSIPVAMAGWLTPLVAVAAMLLSSLSVTGNTLLMMRLAKQTENRPTP